MELFNYVQFNVLYALPLNTCARTHTQTAVLIRVSNKLMARHFARLVLPDSQRQSAPVSVKRWHPKHHNFPDCYTSTEQRDKQRGKNRQREREFLNPQALMLKSWVL